MNRDRLLHFSLGAFTVLLIYLFVENMGMDVYHERLEIYCDSSGRVVEVAITAPDGADDGTSSNAESGEGAYTTLAACSDMESGKSNFALALMSTSAKEATTAPPSRRSTGWTCM